MKRWEKNWLYGTIIISIIHLIRDIFQSLGFRNILSTFLESPGPPKLPLIFYYTIFNTVLIAIIEIILSLICIKRNKFGLLGKTTMLIASLFFVEWLIYYFLL